MFIKKLLKGAGSGTAMVLGGVALGAQEAFNATAEVAGGFETAGALIATGVLRMILSRFK